MKIRERKHKSGGVSWQLDQGVVDGKRRFKLYKTESEAKLELAKAKAARLRHGKRGAALTVAEMADVIVARDKLRPLGATLSQAVEYYVAHHAGVEESVTLEVLSARFRDSREAVSERYLRQLKVSVGSLAALYPDLPADEVERSHIEAWLAARGWQLKTKINYLGDVRTMYKWAIDKKFAARSPCDGIVYNKKKLRSGEIQRLNVEQCRALLQAAKAQPDIMAFLVLALFGGIRPAEIGRMDWSLIELGKAGESEAFVPGRHSKTRKNRAVDLSANAIAWLNACGGRGEGKICKRGFQDRWAALRRRLGWRVGLDNTLRTKARQAAAQCAITHGIWPHDGLRHTFASMHYGMHRNEHALQALMGHESADMLHTHYRGLVKRSEAALFWALVPQG